MALALKSGTIQVVMDFVVEVDNSFDIHIRVSDFL